MSDGREVDNVSLYEYSVSDPDSDSDIGDEVTDDNKKFVYRKMN